MAPTILITCPHCGKKNKGPAELIGRKIRCGACGETYKVAAGPVIEKPAKPTAAKTKPAAEKKTSPKDEDDDGPANYALIEESAVARCPHCAQEMPSNEAIICLHCGYNTRTRTRQTQKVTIEHTPGDYILWHLPGALCVLLVIGLVIFDIWVVVNIEDWAKDSFLESEPGKYWIKPTAFSFWTVAATLLIFIVPATRFAWKRHVLHPHPPEKVMKK